MVLATTNAQNSKAKTTQLDIAPDLACPSAVETTVMRETESVARNVSADMWHIVEKCLVWFWVNERMDSDKV